MDNTPYDVHVLFYDGRKAVYASGKRELTMTRAPGTQGGNASMTEVRVNLAGDSIHLPQAFVPVYEHFKVGLRECMRLEAKKEEEIKLGVGRREDLYPATYRHPAYQVPQAAASNPQPAPPSAPQQNRDPIERTIHLLRGQARTPGRSDSAEQSLMSEGGAAALQRAAYLKDVGWCVHAANGNFLMLFHDGTRVAIEAEARCVWYTRLSPASSGDGPLVQQQR